MKNTKKLVSVLLVAMLLITTVVASSASASAAGTLTSYYKTNPNNQVGTQKTISIDGDLSDWNSSMLIAQGTANDDPRVYRENSMHELPVDLYALYGAYDDNNLYLMWEMTNVGDVVCPEQGYVTSQGILWQTQELPFFIAIDTGKTADAIGNQGQLQTGGTLWASGLTFGRSFNRIISINTKAQNGPFVYGGDSTGLNAVEIYDRTTSGIKMKYGLGIVSDKVYGIDKGYGSNNGRVVGDMCSDSSAWVEFNSKGHSSSTMDFFYEMSIPYSELGITKSDVTSNGVGAMVISTFGLSGMDSLPYDLSMNDNADQPDTQSQEINTFEKSDEDHITAAFARIGAQGDSPIIVTNPTTPTTPTTAPTTVPVSEPTNSLTVNGKSNLFSSSTQTDLNVGDTVTVNYNLTANKQVASAQWSLAYDSSKLRLKSSATSDFGAACTVVNATGNPVYGNFTDAESPLDLTSGGTFVSAEFEVLANGSTDVTLTVDELNVFNGSNLVSPVENGVVKTVSGVTLTPTSEVVPGVVTQNLTVKGTSNLFKAATATFDAETNKVTVTYQLKSSVKVIDSEWKLTYDSSKLTLDSVVMPKVNAPALSYGTGYVNGNFTDSDLVDFTSMSDFVVATFDVKGTGTATVNLNVVNLGVAKYSGSTANVAYLVSNGAVKDITSQSGFSGYTYDTNTLINEGGVLVGDVDLNGVVNINDATLLQRYLAEFTTLSTNQLRAADVNKDGKINVKDVTAIRRMLLN